MLSKSFNHRIVTTMSKPVVELVLHNIRSVYNTAAIFRTAECLGVAMIWLSGYTPAPIDRFGRQRPDFHKVALGSEKDVAWEVMDDLADLVESKKRSGYKIVALEQTNDSIQLQSFQITSPIILIPGTETTGIEPRVLELCDTVVEIDQSGVKESLNIHAATAITLWHMLK